MYAKITFGCFSYCREEWSKIEFNRYVYRGEVWCYVCLIKIRNQPLTNQQDDQPLYKGICRLGLIFLVGVDVWQCCAIVLCMVVPWRSWPEMVPFMNCFLPIVFYHLGLFRVGNLPSLPRCRVMQCVCRFLFFERSILNVLIRLNLGDCMTSRRLQHTNYEQHRSFDI